MRTLAKRSIQTITHRTQVVSSFIDADSSNEFFVRRLSDRVSVNRQLFIVTLNINDSEHEVIPFAELAASNDKIRYVVKPSDQYPNIINDSVLDSIETAIYIYMRTYKNKENYCH